MKFTVYILYSPNIGKYYVGYTSVDIETRLLIHLSNHKGFTSRAKDWKIIYTEQKESKTEALILEKQIKKRGAKRYLEDNGCRVTPEA